MNATLLNAAKGWISLANHNIETNDIKIGAIELLYAVKELNDASEGALFGKFQKEVIDLLVSDILR